MNPSPITQHPDPGMGKAKSPPDNAPTPPPNPRRRL